MYPEIEALVDRAEDRYLDPQEIETLKRHAATLAQRVEAYEILRERETDIFQPVADQLLAAFPTQEQATLEKALQHWLLILRYCAMAMLSNNQEFLQQQLLDWFKGLIQTHELQSIELKLYQLLQSRLRELLSGQAWELMQPFLSQAENALLGNEA